MSVNKYNPTSGRLETIAGGTLYADLPLLSWIKYDDQTNLPLGYLKAGDTISQSEYPEAYAKYGSTVPYKADTSELGEYEDITFPTTAQYDGVIITTAWDGGYLTYLINDNKVYIRTQPSGINAGTATVLIHKGDVIGFNEAGGDYRSKVRYYKKSLIVKAKQVALPADLDSAVDSKIEYALDDWEDISSQCVNLSNYTVICRLLYSASRKEIKGTIYSAGTITNMSNIVRLPKRARIQTDFVCVAVTTNSVVGSVLDIDAGSTDFKFAESNLNIPVDNFYATIDLLTLD